MKVTTYMFGMYFYSNDLELVSEISQLMSREFGQELIVKFLDYPYLSIRIWMGHY